MEQRNIIEYLYKELKGKLDSALVKADLLEMDKPQTLKLVFKARDDFEHCVEGMFEYDLLNTAEFLTISRYGRSLIAEYTERVYGDTQY